MARDHDRWADAAGSYVLGALPDDEHAAYEAHLATCAECREEVDQLAPAAHALPASVEPLAPPPTLKARIMAEVQREASLLAAAGPEDDRVGEPAAPRRRRRWSLALPRLAPVVAAVALLVVGVAIGVGATQLGGEDGRTVAATVDGARAPGASVELELSGETATLVGRDMPAPPSGRIYQVWLKRPGQTAQPTSVLFAPNDEGAATASVPGPLDGVAQVLVTDEPAGGSPTPTSDPVVVAGLS